jgi:hypothetical protein
MHCRWVTSFASCPESAVAATGHPRAGLLSCFGPIPEAISSTMCQSGPPCQDHLSQGFPPFFHAPGPFHAGLRNTQECRHLLSTHPVAHSHAELLGPSPRVENGPGFQYVNEVSGPIEPHRAMPLLANSNTLNANGLATSAPNFRENSCFVTLDELRALPSSNWCGMRPRQRRDMEFAH